MPPKAHWVQLAGDEARWGALVANVVEGSASTIKQIVPVLLEHTWGAECMSAVLFGLPVLSNRMAADAVEALRLLPDDELQEAFAAWDIHQRPLHARHIEVLQGVGADWANARLAAVGAEAAEVVRPSVVDAPEPVQTDSWFSAGRSRFFSEPITGAGAQALRQRVHEASDVQNGWAAAWATSFPIDVGPRPDRAPPQVVCELLHAAMMRAGARGPDAVADTPNLLGALSERVDITGLDPHLRQVEGPAVRTSEPARLRKLTDALQAVLDLALDAHEDCDVDGLLLAVSRSPGPAGDALRSAGGEPDRFRPAASETFATKRRETDALLLAGDIHGRFHVVADRLLAPHIEAIGDLDEVISGLDRLIVAVRAQFDTADELEEDWRRTQLLPQVAPRTLVTALLAVYERVSRKFPNWPVTRGLNEAFRRLSTTHQAIAEQGMGLTQTDGWAWARTLAEQSRRTSGKVVFYTEQDLAGAVRGEGLHLAFGVLDGDDAQAESWGREIVKELEYQRVPHHWDGTASVRIRIPPFLWTR